MGLNYLCRMRMCLVVCWIILLFGACANVGTLTGGDEDKSPPQVVEGSTPNFQVNARMRHIRLKFNEWIKLENPNANITVSPSLKYPLTTKLKGKSLLIVMDEKETLKENTTYSILFGDAVKDITAGNASKNLKFVFSTGPFLDSCTIRGSVVDGFTNEGKGKILVGVYDNTADTAFTKTKPFYYAFTDDAGNFVIDNVKARPYRITALEDKNQNFIYDQANESIGFLDQDLALDSQNCAVSLRLRLSLPKTPSQVVSKNVQEGRIGLAIKPHPDEYSISHTAAEKVHVVDENDSIVVWYAADTTTDWYIKCDGRTDTIRAPKTSGRASEKTLRTLHFDPPIVAGDTIRWKWSEPIAWLDPMKIKIFSNNQKLEVPIAIDEKDVRYLHLVYPYDGTKQIELHLEDSALVSWRQNYNFSDTLRLNLVESDQLARLQIRLDSLVVGGAYVFQLLDRKTIVKERAFIAQREFEELKFGRIIPGSYNARLIFDSNGNKKWDPAHYERKLQAEPVWHWTLQELRADWDMDITLKL